MKKLITLLTLLLTVCSGAWADSETIFSANPTAAWSVPASTTDAEITSSYATISGGNMYLTNAQTKDAKDLIKSQRKQRQKSLSRIFSDRSPDENIDKTIGGRRIKQCQE